MSSATYVYGLVPADTQLPDELHGLGPTGEVAAVTHGELAALVGDVPTDQPLGTRDDLLAHEQVVDTVAADTTVLPMRFGAVLASRDAVVEELLAPHHDQFVAIMSELADRVQYTLRARYDEQAVLREVLAERPEVRELRERVQGKPEDATYYDRIRLGELVVAAIEERRGSDAAVLHERLEQLAVAMATHEPGTPEEVVHTAFLVERAQHEQFEAAVEELDSELRGRIELRLLGPLAPYDFVAQD